ncbi:hypothetical protein JTB14_010445 [Gonioctena quinquepunctata]|nr:hypothetical protein JTB14_010445 [Gonioctena quinquepunctata]
MESDYLKTLLLKSRGFGERYKMKLRIDQDAMDKESIFIERIVSPLSKKERLIAFYKHQKFADCTFIIDGIEVKAHKLILACSSPVFEKMLYGDMAQDVIEICDISLQEFNQVLDHIYTESIDIFSIVNAWDLFYIANKYLLDDLIHICLTYIRNNLTMSSLALSYEYAEMYDLLDIKKKCFDDMISYVHGLFIVDYHMKPTTLCAILDEVNAVGTDQFDLLTKVINWCIVECNLRKILVSPNNIKDILIEDNILHFFQVTLEYSLCSECGYSLCHCLDEVVKKTLSVLFEVLTWCKEAHQKRTYRPTPKICRIRKEFKIACRLDLDNDHYYISSFSVNRRMMVFGVMINTQMEPPRSSEKFYKGIVVTRICEHQSLKEIVKPTRIDELIPYNSDLYLQFKNLVVLEPNKIYDMRISHKNCDIEGPTPMHCYYMSNKLTSNNNEDAVSFYEVFGTIVKGLSFYPA